ncbi:carotenoid oxygenase family protein [Rhodococcus koreensis]
MSTRDRRQGGPFTPMRFEANVDDCLVTQGELPKDLAGGFYRCGPTYRRPTKQGAAGITSMDGMVQGLIVENGRAHFRNRWIRTPKFEAEERHGRGLFEWADGEFGDWRNWSGGFAPVIKDDITRYIPSGTNNINVFPFAGEIITVGEQGSPPIALDARTLETKGIVPWSTQLSAGMAEPVTYGDASFTAHPKWDDRTGEVFGWTYRDKSPFVTIHIVQPNGTVITRDLEDAPYNTVAHDMWLTESYLVLPFQPYIASFDRIGQGLGVFGWDPSLPIVLALVPRDDVVNGRVRYIEADIELQHVLHTLSANEVDGKIILDAPIFDRAPFQFEDRFKPGDPAKGFWELATSSLGRWIVDVERGTVTSERVDDRPCELPKVDERFFGQNYDWGYLVAGERRAAGGIRMNQLVARNVRTGKEDIYKFQFEQPSEVLEATFVPRTVDSPEGDGYLVVPVSRWREAFGEYLFFDTEDISQGPVATVELPFRMGWTPHGHWMDFRS